MTNDSVVKISKGTIFLFPLRVPCVLEILLGKKIVPSPYFSVNAPPL